MRTSAGDSFEENWKSITDLMTIGEGVKRTQSQRAAVNKAALIFAVTAWESYVEDVLREGATLMAAHCPSFQDLPKSVRSSIITQVTPAKGPGSKSPSGKYPDSLADGGWRSLFRDFAIDATEGGNFNTPKTEAVQQLFKKWLGVDVTDSWSWQRFESPKAGDRLDETIVLRGSIVHTGSKPDGLNRNWINMYGESNIRKLVARTDDAVVEHVNKVCGQDVWQASNP